jgi:UDP-N-acetylglucosamine acyltransferase
MSNNIHPTALIADTVEIGNNVTIGPYCVLNDNVIIHDEVTLHSHVAVSGNTKIGSETVIFPFASIGLAPQDLKYNNEPSELIIGNNNTIREYVTLHPGTEGGGMKTLIGDNCLFMIGAHVAHDCVVGDNVIMANNATLAGHVQVGDFAIIGGLSAVHQFVRIGSHAVIGGMSGVENDVIPYGRVKGERAFLAGLNLIGLERRGFNRDQIKVLQKAFNQLFNDEGTLEQRTTIVEQDYANDELVMKLVKFIREKTKFPICQPPKKVA